MLQSMSEQKTQTEISLINFFRANDEEFLFSLPSGLSGCISKRIRVQETRIMTARAETRHIPAKALNVSCFLCSSFKTTNATPPKNQLKLLRTEIYTGSVVLRVIIVLFLLCIVLCSLHSNFLATQTGSAQNLTVSSLVRTQRGVAADARHTFVVMQIRVVLPLVREE